MNKRLFVPIATIVFAGLMASFASSAVATPTQKSPCSGCHSSDSAVTVAVTQVSNDGTNATYNLTVSNPYGLNGWAVFSGSTKLAGTAAGTATFTVPDGKTYTVFGVSGDGNGTEGYGSTTISPAAPADVLAPVTTSNALATYVSSAAITLSATDAGSGVAATYYQLDGGAQVAGTSVTVTTVGSHTLEFWSVDVAGNIETHNTDSFTITASVPDPTGLYTVRTHVFGEHVAGRVATLTNTVTGATFTARIGRNRIVTFTDIPEGTYNLSVQNGVTLRTISVPLAPREDSGADAEHMRSLED